MERDSERCFKRKRGLNCIHDCTCSKIWLPIELMGEDGDLIGIENGLSIGNFLSSSSNSYMQQSLRSTELL